MAILTCSGTWAAPGVGYPSDVARACADVGDEIPVQAPWSFGPIPPGDFRAPSYAESVEIGVDWAVEWIMAHEDRPVVLGGYSQGGESASRIRMEFEPGGKFVRSWGDGMFSEGKVERVEDQWRCFRALHD